MQNLLIIKCSPKHTCSDSYQLTEHFVEQLLANSEFWQVDVLDLWREALPVLDESSVAAKMAKFAQQPLNTEQTLIWDKIEHQFQRFNQASAVLIALPVWNFGVPYVLKHYIDTITQPDLCFSWSPEEGYVSLLEPRPVFIFASSAADYRPGAGNEVNDFCMSYLRRWLTVYMGSEVTAVVNSHTVDVPATVTLAKQQAYEQVEHLARKLIELSDNHKTVPHT